MSFTRGIGDSRSSSATHPFGARTPLVREEERRVVRTTVLGEGTLACARCDAPVFIGPDALPPSATLGCPYCGHQARVRDFLSLTRPTRPARVVVRVRPRV
jgi:DNA-directed RNA polymerase subunit RPC12/RpoP